MTPPIYRIASALLLGALCALAHAADSATLTATARALAGLEPAKEVTSIHAITQNDAWKTHRRANEAGITKLRARLAAMDAWQTKYLAPHAAASRTLIYPFSGPDFINAYALFPNADTYVLFSLEEPGEVPRLASMPAPERGLMFKDLRLAMNDMVHLNFFITPNMKEQVRESSLKGTVPVLLTMMGMLELNVLRVQAIDLWPERTATLRELPRGKQPKLPLRAVQIDFQNPAHNAASVQSLYYFSLDVSDAELGAYPEFMDWLRGFQPPMVLLKSASYLLHGNHFNQVKRFILERAALVVQDDTGVPYKALLDAGLTVQLHGQYEIPVELFKTRLQDDLAAAFKARTEELEPVPFPFGYNWRKQGKSFVMVAEPEKKTESKTETRP